MSLTERAIYDLDTKTMPLTRVSIEYNTWGLEFRFQQALSKLELEEQELVLIQSSLKLALDLHKDDTRTYEPYNNHILRVALRLIEDIGVTDPVIIAASLLHDSIEDHAPELASRYGGIEIIDEDQHTTRDLGHMGLVSFAADHGAPKLPRIVMAVSNPLMGPDTNKIVSYFRHIEALMKGEDIESKLLKIADLLDNLDVPAELEDPIKRAYLDLKQIDVYRLIEAALEQPGTDIDEGLKNAILAVLILRHAEALRRIESVTLAKSA
jgi:hypothetical protein